MKKGTAIATHTQDLIIAPCKKLRRDSRFKKKVRGRQKSSHDSTSSTTNTHTHTYIYIYIYICIYIYMYICMHSVPSRPENRTRN